MFDPEGGDHLTVVDARADDHPGPRLLQPEVEAEADHDRDPEDEEPGDRVLDVGEMDRNAPIEHSRPGDVLGKGAEVRDHLVGQDDRDRDRDQRLPELLTLVPTQEQLLHRKTDEPDRHRRDHRRNEPLPEAHLRAQDAEGGVLTDELALELQGDVAAEQEERAVRHVHDPHQPEDEREPTGDHEVHASGGEAVQQGDDEVVSVVDRRAERRLDPRAARLGARPGSERTHTSAKPITTNATSRGASRAASPCRSQSLTDGANVPTSGVAFNGQPRLDCRPASRLAWRETCASPNPRRNDGRHV